jgi:acyl-CoA reductase-like NAD-dependent aldehyde dehydrogenase
VHAEQARVTAPETPRAYRMLVGGDWIDASDGRSFSSLNPYSGLHWATIPHASASDVDAAVRAAREALAAGPWHQLDGRGRARLLHALADLIAEHGDRLARIESTDNGKVIREVAGQLQSIPDWYRYFAGLGDKIEAATIPSRPTFLTYTRREPIGVVAAIVPWNSPLLLLSFKLAPALAAGCTVVVKPAEQASASILELCALLDEAGLPPGVVNAVTGPAEVGRHLVGHPGVDKVAFTGSTAAGVDVMRHAAGHLARVGLELGGKSANIVFEDADLDAAGLGAVAGIFAAAGQTCVAGSRLFVHRSVYEPLLERLVDRARTLKLGDPLDPETEMGPVAFPEQFEKIMAYIQAGLDEGARLAFGGARADIAGASGLFVQPTIFVDVRNDMRIAREEIFGPVLCVIPFDDENEAVTLSNESAYGLAAGLWTRDLQRAHRVAHALNAGTVWVNAYRVLSYDVPFGGFGMSGIGAENGRQAIDEYTRLKAVWVALETARRDPFKLG